VKDFLDFLEAKPETCKHQGIKRKADLHTEKLSLTLLWE
jgi:hypothetical protein